MQGVSIPFVICSSSQAVYFRTPLYKNMIFVHDFLSIKRKRYRFIFLIYFIGHFFLSFYIDFIVTNTWKFVTKYSQRLRKPEVFSAMHLNSKSFKIINRRKNRTPSTYSILSVKHRNLMQS